MAQPQPPVKTLDWHGWGRCHDCEWTFSGYDLASLDADKVTNRHLKDTGHAVTTGMHRLHFCQEFGCVDSDPVSVVQRQDA